ncbi:VanZ family protein [Bacillus coahuilensis]|uniref:VanZ family protein n=1 Tax=Bacillus coahuilensis TaxID=408580 RepID=UPI00031B354E|nr:VanZ family protein [Bacillus coahuilensis]
MSFHCFLISMIMMFLFLRIWIRERTYFTWRKLLPYIVFFLATIGIALVTLTPQEGNDQWKNYNFIPFSNFILHIQYNGNIFIPLRSLIANILLFLPFGAACCWIFIKQSRPVFVSIYFGFLLSLTIEVTQFYLPLGRSIDIDDLSMNTLGSLIGAIIVLLIAKHIEKETDN